MYSHLPEEQCHMRHSFSFQASYALVCHPATPQGETLHTRDYCFYSILRTGALAPSTNTSLHTQLLTFCPLESLMPWQSWTLQN